MDYANKLSKMIQCETISSRFEDNSEKFVMFHKVLKELFPNLFKLSEVVNIDNNLLFFIKGDSNRNLLLMSHQDVVEANGDWKFEPFSGEIIDGVIRGRGTVDTKGSLFCILQAVDELLSCGHRFNANLYIASSNTEEIGGDGATKLVNYLKEKNIHIDLLMDEGGMIIDDPIAGAKGRFAMIGVLEKGYGDLKFIARGHGGHASYPSKDTPVARLAKFINDVETNDPFKIEFNPTFKEMFRRLAPSMPSLNKFVFNNLKYTAPIVKSVLKKNPQGLAMTKTTIAFTMMHGSDGLNVLPAEAYVTANLRFSHHEPTEKSIEIISKIAKKYDIETEVIYTFDPCPVVSYDSSEFHLIERVLKDIYPGVKAIPYIMTGGTDARYFSSICENGIRFAPLYITKEQMSSIHGINENINIDSLSPAVEFYKEIIKQFK